MRFIQQLEHNARINRAHRAIGVDDKLRVCAPVE
jgi:hypothetical protein